MLPNSQMCRLLWVIIFVVFFLSLVPYQAIEHRTRKQPIPRPPCVRSSKSPS